MLKIVLSAVQEGWVRGQSLDRKKLDNSETNSEDMLYLRHPCQKRGIYDKSQKEQIGPFNIEGIPFERSVSTWIHPLHPTKLRFLINTTRPNNEGHTFLLYQIKIGCSLFDSICCGNGYNALEVFLFEEGIQRNEGGSLLKAPGHSSHEECL